MQGIIPPSLAQLLGAGQIPLLKVEIDVGGWVNLCTLDAKNYVESVSVSLGGAGMTPNPIGGSLTVTLANEGSIFHPLHPTSGYEDYIEAGRQVKISIGAKYGVTDYYWQRIIGYIDEPDFETPSFKVNISGGDYMKFLEDLELREPIETQWRLEETFNSIASDGRGTTEYYNNADAMDIPDEAGVVPNWIDSLCTISPLEGATDNTGDTTDESPIITGMTDTSGFFLGVHVQISAGFPAGNHKVLEKTATTITLDVDANATVANVTVNYYVGKVLLEAGANGDPALARLENVFVPVEGVRYSFRLQYKSVLGVGRMRVVIYHHNGDYNEIARREGLEQVTWTEENITFIAESVDPIEIWIYFYDGAPADEWYLDLFTIRTYVPPEERYYELQEPVAPCNGIYRVLIDEGEGAGFEDVWQGEEDVGYYYTEEEEFGPDPPAHPPKIVWFDKNRIVPSGTANLKIQYFRTVSLENMIADILVTAGLYVDRAAAIDAMDDYPGYAAPAIDIDQVWFKVGEPALGAIRMICERANYRFFFTWEGKPAFIPAPAGAVVFEFTAQSHIASVRNYQDRDEIWNRIIIEGSKRADPVNLEEARGSQFIGEAADDGVGDSIDTYGERTKTIKNHLFQNQADLNAMCATLLAEYKDPKWYADIEVPFNPVPLELGDKITWKERLSPTVEITQTGIIRDIKISTFTTTYKCVIV